MKNPVLIIVVLFLFGSSCSLSKKGLPKTLGEEKSAYSYIPIDPLPVFTGKGYSCRTDTSKFKKLLECLPDQAVRLAIGEYDVNGSLSFGPATTGYKNKSYQVILDYISVDVAQLPVYVEKSFVEVITHVQESNLYGQNYSASSSIKLPKAVNLKRMKYRVTPAPRFNNSSLTNERQYFDSLSTNKGELYVIPIYIGVGLRLTATVTVLKGEVDLSSLGAIAAEASVNKLTGTLVVQTLGITGKSVASSLPLPSEINQTTIQNAILSLGAIKAVLYDQENTIITPRVVGIYDPIGGGQDIVNGVISVLAANPIEWFRPCESPR